MEEKYGRKEIVKIIDDNIKLPTSLDEPLPGQMISYGGITWK